MSSTDTSTTAVSFGKPKPKSIVLTDAAAAKVAQLLATETEPNLALRVAVRPGGCSGYSYEMFFDGETDEGDIRQSFGEVTVVTDRDSARLLAGATLDYKDTLQGAGFAVNNPNAQRTCGCGQSFS